MDCVELPDPGLPPARLGGHRAPLLTGICGSDAKQVFMDWGEGGADNPMREFSSMPQVLGHEVVAEVVALGPEAEGVADRRPGGAQPVAVVRAARRVTDLPGVRGRRPQPVLELPDAAASRPASTSARRGTRPVAGPTLMPAHPSMLFPVPDSIPDEVAVFADPFAVSLHAITRHPPTPGGKVLVYGAGALGTCAVAILRALYPDVEVGVVARFGAQADLAQKLGAHEVFAHEPAER